MKEERTADIGEVELMNDEQLDRIAARLAEKLTALQQDFPPRLMDVEQAAKYMGRSTDAMKHMVQRKSVPITRIDGKVQLDREALDKLIRESTRW